MHLNGWQRLWLVGVVLWTLPVLIVSYFNWPSHAMTAVGQVDYYALAELARKATPQTKKYSAPLTNGKTLTLEGDTSPTDADFEEAAREKGVTLVPKVVIVENDGTEHVFPPGFDPKKAAANVRQALRIQRTIFAGETLAAWTIPAALFYVLGWAVGWIRRGFQAGTANLQ